MGRLLGDLNKMSYCNYVSPSVACMKYQRQGCVDKRPFLPGERYSIAREMGNNVTGFREVSRNLSYSRRVLLHGEDAHNILLQVSSGHKVKQGVWWHLLLRTDWQDWNFLFLKEVLTGGNFVYQLKCAQTIYISNYLYNIPLSHLLLYNK